MIKTEPPQAVALPQLSMKPQFARWVLAGRKTSTLRSKVFPAGRYVMKIRGVPYAEVDVESDGVPIYWSVNDEMKGVIARAEGFADAEQFEDALNSLQIHGNFWLRPFLAGTKPMYLHLLSNPTLCAEVTS